MAIPVSVEPGGVVAIPVSVEPGGVVAIPVSVEPGGVVAIPVSVEPAPVVESPPVELEPPEVSLVPSESSHAHATHANNNTERKETLRQEFVMCPLRRRTRPVARDGAFLLVTGAERSAVVATPHEIRVRRLSKRRRRRLHP